MSPSRSPNNKKSKGKASLQEGSPQSKKRKSDVSAVKSEEKAPGLRKEDKRKCPRNRWTDEENTRLLALKKDNPDIKWNQIIKKFPNRTLNSCQVQWLKIRKISDHSLVVPTFHKSKHCKGRRGHWSAEEDELFLKIKKENLHASWETIAEMIPGRSVKACISHWYTIRNKNNGQNKPHSLSGTKEYSESRGYDAGDEFDRRSNSCSIVHDEQEDDSSSTASVEELVRFNDNDDDPYLEKVSHVLFSTRPTYSKTVSLEEVRFTDEQSTNLNSDNRRTSNTEATDSFSMKSVMKKNASLEKQIHDLLYEKEQIRLINCELKQKLANEKGRGDKLETQLKAIKKILQDFE